MLSVLANRVYRHLFLAQASKDIAFARHEVRGADYLQALTPTITALTQQTSGSCRL